MCAGDLRHNRVHHVSIKTAVHVCHARVGGSSKPCVRRLSVRSVPSASGKRVWYVSSRRQSC
eukprot:scaffold164565_cov18-Tisochrysis_lutea.AAC.1